MNLQKNSPEYIERLITENQITQAMEMLDHVADNKATWFRNAQAVCLMRLNRPKDAVQVLTPIVYHGGSVVSGAKVPDKVKLNLVEAMLLAGNVAGAASLMEDIKEESQHRKKLITAFKKWKKSLSPWSRFATCFGSLPYDRPVALDHPLGEP